MRQGTKQSPAEFKTGRPRVTITFTERRYSRPYFDQVRSKSITINDATLEDVLAQVCDSLELTVPEAMQ